MTRITIKQIKGKPSIPLSEIKKAMKKVIFETRTKKSAAVKFEETGVIKKAS